MKISHLIFDMDNTLYPASGEMNKGIWQRMMECTADFFHVSVEEAEKIREKRIGNYSTTMEWLMDEGLSNMESFLAHVHPDGEENELQKAAELKPFLDSINLPKIILTNAPMEHAERVLNKLEIKSCFDAICDIRFCNFKGKPYKEAYDAALKISGGTYENSLFLDDMQKYTQGFTRQGGDAVLIGNSNGSPMNPDSPMMKAKAADVPGKLYHLESVYGLKELLRKING